MASLVVVESEAKAKALYDQTGGIYDTLILPSVPMKVAHDPKSKRLHTGETGFRFAPAENRKEFAKALLAGMNNEIYLALDSDQRGEFWSWMIGKFFFNLTNGAKTVRRVQVTGFTKEAIDASFSHIEPLQDAAAASLYIRSLFNNTLVKHIGRLLGTHKGPGGLPLNYISLTTLFLLEEREAEIASFAIAPKWRITVRLAGSGGEFDAHLREAYGVSDDGLLRDIAELEVARSLFENKPFSVDKVEESDFVREAPVPCRLSEMLQRGMTLLGMAPGSIIRALQKLFHGIEVDGKTTGLISSPFLQMPPDAFSFVIERIQQTVIDLYGQDALVSRDFEGAVILPLRPDVIAKDLSDVLTEEEGKLYEMIRCRCLASQMEAVAGSNITVTLSSGECLFQVAMPNVTEKGFLQADDQGYDSSLLEPCSLVGLQPGQELAVKQIIPEQTSGVDQEFYTFDTLLDDLLDFSIQGEPPIIAMLQDMLDKGYLSIDAQGCLHCGPNSTKVSSTINRAFPGMMGINLTAYVEQTVSEVTIGRKPLDFAMTQFEQNFIMHGNPLVKVVIPKSVPRRIKRSKNIIKSSGPVASEPVLRDIAAPVVAPPSVVADIAEEIMAGQEEDQVIPPDVVEEEYIGNKEPQEVIAAEKEEETPEIEISDEPVEQAVEEIAEGEEQQVEPDYGLIDEAEGAEEVGGHSDEVEQEVFEKSAPMEELETAQEHIRATIPSAESTGVPADIETVQPDKMCPDCGRPLLLKHDRFGEYWACSGYPACRHSESHGTDEEKLELLCPLCTKEAVTIKRTPTGKKLYVCPGRECEFMAWSLPHAIACPSCGSPFLVEKKGAGGRNVLRCPRAGCSFQQPLPGQEGLSEPMGGDQVQPKKKKVLVRRKKGSGGTGKKKRVLVRRKKK